MLDALVPRAPKFSRDAGRGRLRCRLVGYYPLWGSGAVRGADAASKVSGVDLILMRSRVPTDRRRLAVLAACRKELCAQEM